MVIFVWLAASWLPGFELFSDRTLKSNHFHFPQFVVRHYRKTNHIMAYFAVNIYTYVCTSVHSNLRTFLTISLSLSLFSSPCPRGVFRDLFVCVYNWNYYLFFNRTEFKKKCYQAYSVSSNYKETLSYILLLLLLGQRHES